MTRTPDELVDQGFHEVAALDEIPEVMPRRVEIEGRGLLLCRSGNSISAVDEICPHKERSMAFGIVHGGKIICPHHQYGFDLKTGRCDRRKCMPVETYEVEVVDGRVFVRADHS